LGLPSLEERRREADMVQVYKILKDDAVNTAKNGFQKWKMAPKHGEQPVS
jgi:hypothetical protein